MTVQPQSSTPEPPPTAEAAIVERAFGEENRARLIGKYFAQNGNPTAEDAWKHVYRLLLWVDPTIGLAHCYESDKCQPGKPWYLRSLAFHAWLAEQFGVTAEQLVEHIDWLFERASAELGRAQHRLQERRAATADRQRARFAGMGMPLPGHDPELVSVIQDGLGAALPPNISETTWAKTVRRVREHVGVENKRKNLVGEGFEDVLAQVVRRVVPPGLVEVHTRALLGTLPGFERAHQAPKDKANKVDLPILRTSPGPTGAPERSLVTVKWSIRADREKQFPAEFDTYVAARSDQVPFTYVLITNEFDPARLMRQCETSYGAGSLFASVVHINPDALAAVYRADAVAAGQRPPKEASSMATVLGYVAQKRIISLAEWLQRLSAGRL